MDESLRTALVADYEARLADFDAVDASSLTDTERESRSKAAAALEALKSLEGQPPAPAAPAPKELTDKVELRRYAQAAMNESDLNGAEAELNQELGLSGRGMIPLSVLDMPLETRADVNTVITAGDFDSNVRPAIIPAFAGSDLAHLGISPTRVRPGTTKVPIVSNTGGVATAVAKSASVSAAAGAFTSVDFNVKEVRKRFRYSFAETYEWGMGLENALRTVLRMALSERLDDMAIAGSGANNEPTGIFGSLTAPADPTGEATFDDYVAAASDVIDGKYTNDENGMAILIGLATIKHARTKRQAASGMDAIKGMQDLGVSVRASSRVAAVNNTRQDALVALSSAAARDSYFVSVWNSFRLIKDESTHSDAGDVALTATLFYDAKELMDGGIKRVRFQVA